MTNRVAEAIERVKSHPNLSQLEGKQGISFDDHFVFQNTQSQAFASGKLTMEEAQIAYIALGEVWTKGNEGWAEGTDLATKVIVTKLVGELIGV